MLMSYCLVATWWQARKHIANWWLWIVVDAIYIGEYIYKDLWPTALLYAAFVPLAVLGLRDWRRAAASCLARRLHHILQRLAVHVAPQLIGRGAQRARRKLRRRSADVRREQQIRATPQRMTFRQRLGIGHVERGANPSRVERLDQRIRIHDRPARGSSPAARPGAAAPSCRSPISPRDSAVDGKNQHHHIRARQQVVQLAHRVHLRLGASGARHAHHRAQSNGASMRSISLPIAP